MFSVAWPDPPVAVFELSHSLPELFSCGSHLDLRSVPLAALQASKCRGGVLVIAVTIFPSMSPLSGLSLYRRRRRRRS